LGLACCLITLGLMVNPCAIAQVRPPELTRYSFVSEADDIRAAFVNPAGLSLRRRSNLLVQGSWQGRDFLQGVLGWQNPFFSVGYYGDDFGPHAEGHTWVLAQGFGSSTLGIGYALNFHKGTGQKGTSYDAGLLARPARFLSLAIVGKSLNHPTVRGVEVKREIVGGISLRVAPLFETLTLSFQPRYRPSSERLEYLFGGRLNFRGIELFGSYDSFDKTLAAGASFILPHASIGAANRSGRRHFGKDAVQSYTVHTHIERRRDALEVLRRFAEVEISGDYEDHSPGFSLLGHRGRSARRVIETLRKAREDRDIRGLLLKIGSLGDGFIGNVSALHQEIRDAIVQVKQSGKPVIAYLSGDGVQAQALYLATAAEEIVVPETSLFLGIGTALEVRRLKATLKKFGLDWDYLTAGRYKSTFHTLMTDSATGEQKEQLESLVKTAYEELVKQIAQGRGLPEDRVREIADGRLFSAQEALAWHLVDRLGWYPDARELAAKKIGRQRVATSNRLERRVYWNTRWTPLPIIALIPAYGQIVVGKSKRNYLTGERVLGSETVTEQLRAASKARGVRAMVLRVDSGGGSAQASDRIFDQMRRIKQEKKLPLIVSMANVAASGGYWISALADTIVANPLTVTGSIGVVMAKPVIEDLYGKLAVRNEVFKAGEHADMLSPSRHGTDEEMARVGHYIDDFYHLFLKRVAEGRTLSVEEVQKVAEGRVWMGQQAQAVGLVDELGGLERALDIAAKRAGVEKYQVVTFGAERGFLESLFRDAARTGLQQILSTVF